MNTKQKLSERPEWIDATPLYPPIASDMVVAIQTDPYDAQLMAYFWGAVTSNELSERVLSLSEEILTTFNSAHFSVWEWRWRCLETLGKLQSEASIRHEIALMRKIATDNPKNYQLWNHRRKFALYRGAADAELEMEFSQACLMIDAKNYHAWAHRQAVLLTFGRERPDLWARELAFIDRLLREDVWNNSAWNQRWFVVINADGKNIRGYKEECTYVYEKISIAPHNEAAWGYLRGLAKLHDAPPRGFDAASRAMAMKAVDVDPNNVPALVFIADMFSARAESLNTLAYTSATVNEAKLAAKAAALDIFEKLQIACPSRRAYYKFRAQSLQDSIT